MPPIGTVVRPGDVVLDVGAGSGILSVFAARAGAARVYSVEATSVAVLAQELAHANRVADIVRVIQGDIADVELPEPVDVIVSEWLGGFGIDEGMLVPVITARDRWLKPGGTMIPDSVTAWVALVHDAHLGQTLEFLRSDPYGIELGGLVEKTVNEISYSGGSRHLGCRRQALTSRLGCGRRTRVGSRWRRRPPLTRLRFCSASTSPGRRTRWHSGSAPNSHPAPRCPSALAIRRRTGG